MMFHNKVLVLSLLRSWKVASRPPWGVSQGTCVKPVKELQDFDARNEEPIDPYSIVSSQARR